MSDNNDNNETLFWKIIHNKYLFQLIFDKLHTTQWVEYNNIKDVQLINMNNRIKVKHLNNLKWLIENNQIQLLKCKLEAGEHIEIEKIDIHKMFRSITNGIHDQKDKVNEESLKLLLKYKSFQLSEFDINNVTIGYFYDGIKNLKLVSFLSEYSTSVITIYPSALKWVIENSDSKLLDGLFNLSNTNNIISQNLKDNSISYAFNNIKYKEEMLEYILKSNGKLYSIPWVPTSNYDDGSLFITKIDLISIFSLKSKSIQKQLIELNYFNVHQFIDESETDNILMDVNIENKTKEIHRVISLLDESYYPSYLVNYDGEEINGVNVNCQLKLQSDMNLLKYKQICTNIEFLKYFSSSTFKSRTLFLSGRNLSFQSIFDFISAYSSPLNQLVNDTSDNEIITFITFLIKNKQDFDNALKSIAPTSNLLNQLPKSWNPILLTSYYEMVIKDIETIYWILENSNTEFFSKRKGTDFQFQTSDLMNYAQNKFKSIPRLAFQLNYKYQFIHAISNCNIQELQHIINVSSSKGEEDNETFITYSPIKFNENCKSSDILQLLSFLNGNDYRKFDNNLFLEFVKGILNFEILEGTNIEIGIEFNRFGPLLGRVLCLDLVSTFKPIAMKLLFRNDKNNLIKKYPQSLISAMEDNFYTSSITRSKINVKHATLPDCIDVIMDDIIQSIELTLIEFNLSSKQLNKSTEDITYCSTLEKLIGYQFSKLLKISTELPLIKLKEIYQKIVNNELPIELKQYKYHSIYYLGLKSPKLLKYILQFPFTVSPYVHGNGFYCIDEKTLEYQCYDIKKYLDETIFSFDYIFGNGVSFDQILEKLIHHLSHLPCKIDQEMVKNEMNGSKGCNYYDKSFCYNLIYLLEINRHDLFFKELEFINKFESSIPTTEHSFKLMNFKFSSKLIKLSSRAFNGQQFREFITFNSSLSFLLFMEKNRFTTKKLISDIEYSKPFKKFDQSIVESLLNQVDIVNQVLSINGYPIFWGEGFIYDSTLIKYQDYLLKFIKTYSITPNDSILTHELLLKSSSLNIIPDFSKISKDSIKNAIVNGNINFLKFYFEKGIINDENDNKLLSFLKYQLLSHSDYKHVNWLN